MLRKTLATTLFSLALGASALAAELKLGDLTLSDPTLRATAPGAKVAAGYLTIKNNGTSEERLMAGTAPFAKIVEVHEGKMDNGVMTMRAFDDGLVIPAGGTAMLKPGGNHLMFMKVQQALKEGESHEIVLKFKNAGETTVTFPVKSIGDTIKMKMKHNH